MKKTIVIVGWDEFNLRKLQTLEQAGDYSYHKLFSHSELRNLNHTGLEELFIEAEQKLRKFSGDIDAIIGYWDFPVTDMVPWLCQTFGLPSASLESVIKCEHKYWSRVEQQKVIPDLIPQFVAVDPFADTITSQIPIDYPFWLKPVKSFASHLGFRIRNETELIHAIDVTKRHIHRLGEPFNFVLQHVHLPEGISQVDGNHCIAEQIISGRQCTLEGYVFHGDVQIYGIVDSIRDSNRSTFSRFQYPSQLPRYIQKEMIVAAKTLVAHLGIDNSPFNLEFFYNPKQGKIWFLEINPRISQSHCDLFEKVDGVSHHQVMIDLALGTQPRPKYRQGSFNCAAKFLLRKYGDAMVEAIPSEAEIASITERFPGTLIKLHVHPGMRLSELSHQDSYSYELGNVFMGGKNQREMLDNFRHCVSSLTFRYRT